MAHNALKPAALTLQCPQGIEAVACQIRTNRGPISVVSVYIHPRTVLSLDDFEQFFSNIPKPCVVGGDLNAKHESWGNQRANACGNKIFESLEAANMVIMNDGSFTRFDVNRAHSAIDLTLVSADLSLNFE